MSEMKTYTGGCHCGNVRFEVQASLSPVISCNCSICAKTGSLLAFAPAAAFELQKGEEALSDYQFNKKTVHHLFCKTCGVRPFGRGKGPDGSEVIALNVRCLDDVDPSKLTLTPYDGKSL